LGDSGSGAVPESSPINPCTLNTRLASDGAATIAQNLDLKKNVRVQIEKKEKGF